MSAPNPDPEELGPSRGFGETVPLDETGDVQTNSLAQLSSMDGPAVVIQRLKVAFLTPRGSSPMAPEFGFDWFVVGERREVVEAEIRRTVEADPDVRSVADVRFEEPDPDPPENRHWPLVHVSAELHDYAEPISISVELGNLRNAE